MKRLEVHGLEAEQTYDEVEVKNLNLDAAKLTSIGLIDSVILGGSWIGVEIPESMMRRTKIKDMRLSGLVAHTLRAENVTFINCKLDMVNFRSSKFKNVTFTDCVLTDADFQGSTFANVTISNCDIDKVDFNACEFKKVDLRSSRFIDIKGAATLKGVTMSRDQLIMLASILANEIGITIED